MGLMQKEAAKLIGVNTRTILNWEKGRTAPPITSIPAIVQFLGYAPFPEPKTLPQHLLAKCRAMGWLRWPYTRFDYSSNLERGKLILYCQHRVLVARLLGLSADELNKEMTPNTNRQENQSAEYP